MRVMCRVLIIEDNEIDRFILKKMISHYGLFHHIQYSSDACAAIDQIEEDRFDDDKLPDIIFLDLVIPVFNGFDFLERFKKLYTGIKKPVDIYAMTAAIDPANMLRLQTYPFVKDVFIKPLTSAVLNDLYFRYKLAFANAYR